MVDSVRPGTSLLRLPLFLADDIARKLRVSPIERRTRECMHAVLNAELAANVLASSSRSPLVFG